MHDVAITNGRIVTPSGVERGTLVIDGERIAGIADGRTTGRREIDARGLLVIPGIVDSHVHVRDPGFTHKEDFATCSAAAAAGGVTTMMCMPNTAPALESVAAFRIVDDVASRRSIVDYALQALATPRNLGEIPSLTQRGVVSFEMFLGGVPEELLAGRRADVARLFAALASVDALAGVYPDETELVSLLDSGAGDIDGVLRAHPPSIEAGALLGAVALAGAAGARVHYRQMSSALGARCGAWLRAAMPGRFTTEVTPHHLTLTSEDARRHGPYAHIMPPLREREDVEDLWSVLRAGGVDTIGTDHSPHAAEEKARGSDDVRKAATGFPGIETFLPVMLTEFIRRGLTGGDLVRLVAEGPARVFGLYPRKGVLAAGSDADLAIVDDVTEWSVDPTRFLSKAKYSPFAGRRVRGRAVLTMVRGHVVWQDGELVGRPGTGRLQVPRERMAER